MPYADRIYCEKNQATGLTDCYCRTREGVLGPFDSEQMAIAVLQSHIKYCQEHRLDNDRTSGLEENLN